MPLDFASRNSWNPRHLLKKLPFQATKSASPDFRLLICAKGQLSNNYLLFKTHDRILTSLCNQSYTLLSRTVQSLSVPWLKKKKKKSTFNSLHSDSQTEEISALTSPFWDTSEILKSLTSYCNNFMWITLTLLDRQFILVVLLQELEVTRRIQALFLKCVKY